MGSEIVVAGSYGISTGNTSRFYRLYLERRRAFDLAVIGARVEHVITLIAPSPSTNKYLEVAKIVQDAQGRFRFNVDFSRDTGFGIDGVVNLNFGGSGAIRFEGLASDLAVLDNAIIAVTGLGCNTVVEQSFASLATTQNAGRTRHYIAWTYKADNPNTTDTDMVMGELQGATIFADGFE